MNPKYRVVSIIVRGTLLACAWAAGAALAAAGPASAPAAADTAPAVGAPAAPTARRDHRSRCGDTAGRTRRRRPMHRRPTSRLWIKRCKA